MKVSATSLAILLLSTPTFSFAPRVTSSRGASSLFMTNDPSSTRRQVFEKVFTVGFSAAGLFGNVPVAGAGLLEEFGTDPVKIVETKKKKEEEELPAISGKKGEQSIDPTLKGSYYYPTAKKRYLPRIKKVSDTIATVPTAIQENDWDTVSEFADKVADNAVLPLKLYSSSLDGQGLNMANSYVKVMKKDADIFEVKTKDLQKAVKVKNADKALTAVTEMSVALKDYREAGKLTGPDSGGDIPSVEEMRRMAMRRPTTK